MAQIVVGWDIGGANIKAARVEIQGGALRQITGVTRPFELWKAPQDLPGILAEVAALLGDGDAAALTMTAELCDCFPTKRAGVAFVLEAAARSLPYPHLLVLDVDGCWLAPPEAAGAPLRVASANWVATAHLAASRHANAVMADVGSTTTDIVPIESGKVAARGRTDAERLAAGELIYTAALRTAVNAIVRMVPLRGRWCRTSAEYFAAAADVHLILGHLSPDDYTCVPPDGGDRSVQAARRRLARVVCADEEMLSPWELDGMARFIHHRQVSTITEGLLQVLSAMDRRAPTVVVTGAGKFLAEEAARRVGLTAADLDRELGLPRDAAASCVALAWLLAGHIAGETVGETGPALGG